MSESNSVVVTEVQVGDLVKFPNSRKPQPVTQVVTDGDFVTLHAEKTQWQINATHEVVRVTE